MQLTTHILNDKFNYFVDLLQYYVNTIPQFQYIVDKIGEKVNFEGWLSVRIKLVERPVFCLGQDEAIFKHYIFAKNMCTHKGKLRFVPKDEGCRIMILAFQS